MQKSEEIILHAGKKGYKISEKIAIQCGSLGPKFKRKTKASIKAGKIQLTFKVMIWIC